MKRCVLGLAVLVLLLLGGPATAGFITPSGLKPGDQFRVVFVTQGIINATSNAFSTYDSLVGAEATAAGLTTYNGSPVTWEAIVSVSSTLDAISRLPADNVPLYLPDGVSEVAVSGSALWSTATTPLLHGISEAATGATRGIDAVWTGTSRNGHVNTNQGGALGSGGGTLGGVVGGTDPSWVAGFNGNPLDNHPLYGFSSILTVAQPTAAAVPEPSTLTLLGVGVIGLLVYRPRKATA
jgi:hypothetical protein